MSESTSILTAEISDLRIALSAAVKEASDNAHELVIVKAERDDLKAKLVETQSQLFGARNDKFLAEKERDAFHYSANELVKERASALKAKEEAETHERRAVAAYESSQRQLGEEMFRAESAESRVRSLEADLKAERERADEAERSKYGTPCKCESWIETCRQAEERAEATEALLRKCIDARNSAEGRVERLESAMIQHNNCGYPQKCDECAVIHSRACWLKAALQDAPAPPSKPVPLMNQCRGHGESDL